MPDFNFFALMSFKKDIDIEKAVVSPSELQLALQIIAQISEDAYDPAKYEDVEKKRVLAAIDEKISGKQVVASAYNEEPSTGQVIDLMEALKASLGKVSKPVKAPATVSSDNVTTLHEVKERKSPRRATHNEDAAPARPRSRAKK